MFNKIRFGVNYVPSSGWWYCWNAFDTAEISRDLDAIAGLNADHIRIMLIWPYFQPNPACVSVAHLDRLEQLMELARDRGLDVCVTMLTGWLSGWSFLPVFDNPKETASGKFFTSPRMWSAVEIYFRSVASRLNRHSNFLGFDLGNELNYCWQSPDTAAGDAWMARLLALCDELSPGLAHVNGVDHNPWFHPATFTPDALARQPRLVAIHSWIGFTGAVERSGPMEPACTQLAMGMASLARAYAGDAAKPVWLQEFGASSEWMKEEEIPAFLEKSVESAVAGGICWLTWWASHDISRRFEFSSLEYDLGLCSVDQKIKPAGRVFQRLAHDLGGMPVSMPSKECLLPPPASPADDETTWAWLLNAMGISSLKQSPVVPEGIL